MIAKVFVGSASQEFAEEINTFAQAQDKDVRKVDYQFIEGKVIVTVYYMPAEWLSIAKPNINSDNEIELDQAGAPIKVS
jgi:hypothetical protein